MPRRAPSCGWLLTSGSAFLIMSEDAGSNPLNVIAIVLTVVTMVISIYFPIGIAVGLALGGALLKFVPKFREEGSKINLNNLAVIFVVLGGVMAAAPDKPPILITGSIAFGIATGVIVTDKLLTNISFLKPPSMV